MAGAVVGTPGYISPEMAFASQIDARADIYALACVAWWLLTRSEVFARGDEDEVIRAHALEPVPPLRPLVTGWLPRELEDLILRCLAKRPQERPEDARALLRELRAIPIPPEHAWTDEAARAWWARYQQPPEQPQESAAPERVLVPQRDEAPTIDQRGHE